MRRQRLSLSPGMPGLHRAVPSDGAALWASCEVSGERGEVDPALPILREASYRNLVRHLRESVLEDHALGRLSGFRAERLEEHMLFCPECQERFQAEGQ